MRRDCLAVHEWAELGVTRSSKFAAAQACIYCQGREIVDLKEGDFVVVLNGYDAGSTFEVTTSQTTVELLGRPLNIETQRPGSLRRLKLPYELLSHLPLAVPPEWFPSLSLRDTFIVDELATWFNNRGMATQNFVWRDGDTDEVVRAIWSKRLPITSDELVGVFAAHGLPSRFHQKLSQAFKEGMRLLCYTHNRPPLKNRRLASFDNIDADPRLWFDRYILPGLPAP